MLKIFLNNNKATKKSCLKSPQLALSNNERQLLRQAKIKRVGLAELTADHLIDIGFDKKRAAYIIALSQFQTLASVGLASANDFWAIGLRSLNDLKQADPFTMYEQLRKKTAKGQLDRCVEDVCRCAVAQVKCLNLSEEKKQWWYWFSQRGQHCGGSSSD